MQKTSSTVIFQMKRLQRQDVVCSEKTLIHYAMVRGTKDVLHFWEKDLFTLDCTGGGYGLSVEKCINNNKQ